MIVGWKRDRDNGGLDWKFKAAPPPPGGFPAYADTRYPGQLVFDQEMLGSCVGNGTASHVIDVLYSQHALPLIPSRLFIYYAARMLEDAVEEDAGCEIRDAFTIVRKYGVCPEYDWPYDITKFSVKPSKHCWEEALDHQSLEQFRLSQSLNDLKACLSAGYSFVFGLMLEERFESSSVARSGIVPLPRGPFIGGHCMKAVGYTDEERRNGKWCWPAQTVLVQNSWDVTWGQLGYCCIPYDYFLNPDWGGDFWTIRKMENPT